MDVREEDRLFRRESAKAAAWLIAVMMDALHDDPPCWLWQKAKLGWKEVSEKERGWVKQWPMRGRDSLALCGLRQCLVAVSTPPDQTNTGRRKESCVLSRSSIRFWDNAI